MSAGVAPLAEGRCRPGRPTVRCAHGRSARIEALAAHDGEAFLASATPAAGKTTFGLRVAYDMLSAGRVARVAIVAPTTHICRQWAADAARYGIDLEPNRPNAEGPEPPRPPRRRGHLPGGRGRPGGAHARRARSGRRC